MDRRPRYERDVDGGSNPSKRTMTREETLENLLREAIERRAEYGPPKYDLPLRWYFEVKDVLGLNCSFYYSLSGIEMITKTEKN